MINSYKKININLIGGTGQRGKKIIIIKVSYLVANCGK